MNMGKIIEYKVVGGGTKALSEAVTKLLTSDKGWELYGSPCATEDTSSDMLYQAMIRRERMPTDAEIWEGKAVPQ